MSPIAIKPAAATAHSSWNPNSDPACAEVEIDPTSTKPPMLVTMPRIRSTMTLTGPRGCEGIVGEVATDRLFIGGAHVADGDREHAREVFGGL
jgi:hypothetical protein